MVQKIIKRYNVEYYLTQLLKLFKDYKNESHILIIIDELKFNKIIEFELFIEKYLKDNDIAIKINKSKSRYEVKYQCRDNIFEIISIDTIKYDVSRYFRGSRFDIIVIDDDIIEMILKELLYTIDPSGFMTFIDLDIDMDKLVKINRCIKKDV